MEENPYKAPAAVDRGTITGKERRLPGWTIGIVVCWNVHAMFAMALIAYAVSLSIGDGLPTGMAIRSALPSFAVCLVAMVMGSPIIVCSAKKAERWHRGLHSGIKRNRARRNSA